MVKSTLREIRTSLTRYLAIFAIVALGVGFFSGLKICRDCMVKTASDYLNDKHYYDYQINSSYGIDDGSIKIAEGWDGVTAAEGSIRRDVLVETGSGDQKALRAISMPENINELDLVKGRFPRNSSECLIDANNMTGSGFSIGDVITVADDNDEDRLKDFRVREFTVVGSVNTPIYMDYQRGSTDVGNGSLSAFFFIGKDAFDTDYYTDMYVKIGKTGEYFRSDVEDAISDVLEENKASAEELSETVTAARREELQNEALEELDEKTKEYEDGVAEYEENKAMAESEFAKAENEIANGQQLIDSNLAKAEGGRLEALDAIKGLNARMAEVNGAIERLNAEKQKAGAGLAQAGEIAVQLVQAKAGVEEQTAKLRQMSEEVSVQIAKLEEQISLIGEQIAGIETQIGELGAQISVLREQIAELRREEEAEEDPVRKEELRKQIAALEEETAGLEKQIEELAAQKAGLEAQLTELKGMAEQAAAQKAELEKQIEMLGEQAAVLDEQIRGVDAEIQKIKEGIAVIDMNLAAAENGKSQIEGGLVQADKGLKQAEDGIARLAEEQEKLDAGRAELASQRQEAEARFREAAQQLEEVSEVLKEARQKIDDMAEGESYAVPATKNMGYSSFNSNSDIVSRIAVVFPVFFFLIAALVCMTTMTRMIDEQRSQVGVLKALGYSDMAIAGKYLFYSGSAAFLGAVVGFFAGCRIFPVVIWKAYGMMYGFSDDVAYVIDVKLGLLSLAAALICSMGATWAAISADFKVAPAELIRPKNPPAGRRILMEYITPLWNRISFLYKVSIRNIFRDRKRFLMMVIGISGCTALLIAGAGIGTTVSKIADNQFEEISKYDYTVMFSRDMDADAQKDFEKTLSETGEPAEVMFMHQGEVSIETGADDADVTCIAAPAGDFGRFVDLHSGDEPIAFPAEGEVVIVKRLMRDYGIQAGDEIVIKDGWKKMKVRVSAVADNYINDMIYMSPETYEQGFGEKAGIKAAYVKLGEGADEDAVRASATAAAGSDDVAAVQLSQDVRDNVNNMMKSLDAVTIVIILSAALLAFIVIYNLTNINITERTREIATIKVLGFRPLEVSTYVFRENLFMTAVAVIVGVPLGRMLLNFAIDNIVVKMLCFETKVSGGDIAEAVILTFVFAILVGLAMQKRLRDVSMTESLKSVE
ncbi:MAG: FtsX-like permease family protein [Mogibacterium sp.]|nr:FtsX-like permease family protein [Mogibacterium sp.]